MCWTVLPACRMVNMIWIETEKPHIGQIGHMVDEIRKAVPNAKLVYNNSPF